MQPNQTPPAHELPPEATQDTVAPPSDQSESESRTSNPNHESTNEIWAKDINKRNIIYLIICTLFIAFVDTPIALSNPSLGGFYLLMLLAFGVLVLLAVIEYYASKQLRNTTRSASDVLMLLLVDIRNIIVVLNVIPFIQLLGMLAATFVGPFVVISQLLIVGIRSSRASAKSEKIST